MMAYKPEEHNLKLLDNICCSKCKSKKLTVFEVMSSANIYTTNQDGEVKDVEINSYPTIEPIGMEFRCLTCGHYFKKRKVKIFNDALVEKE